MSDPIQRSLDERVAGFEAAFREIATTCMHGVPVLHPRLSVQAVGFERSADEPLALRVHVTPWFMNLVRLPLNACAPATLAVGETAARDIGTRRIDFIGAHEPGLGAFEFSSLFSPMFEFEDHGAAIRTAREVLALLRPAVRRAAAPVPSRRGFLFGRPGAAA